MFESFWSDLLAKELSSSKESPVAAGELIHCLDLTLLDERCSSEALTQLKEVAQSTQVAAVCVYPQHLHYFQSLSPIELATVINFPQGEHPQIVNLKAIEEAKKLGATEIDYVFPYSTYLAGNKEASLAQCMGVISACKNYDLTVKVIVETGAIPELPSLYELSKTLATSGCDFIKTSTGKIATGATLPAVFSILSALNEMKSHCGLKVSGGVKTTEQAMHYALLAEKMLGKKINKSWFRIGASSLLQELQKINNSNR